MVARESMPERDPTPEIVTVEEQYYALNTERAEAGARELVRALDAGELGRFDEALLVRLLMLVAETALSAGDDMACDEAIARVLAIRSDLVLDAAIYSPVVRARVDARRAATEVEHVPLGLGDVPGNARVWLDGTELRGRAATVLAGTHVVRIEAPGFEPETRSIVATHVGVTVDFDARRSPASLDALAGEPGERLRDEAAHLLAELGWTARILDARSHGDQIEYRWGWANDDDVTSRTLPSTATPTEVAEALMQAEHDAEREAVASARAHRRRRVAGWVTGAVAVSAGAAITGYELRPRAPTWVGRGTIEVNP